MRGAQCCSTTSLASSFIDAQIYDAAILNHRARDTIYSAQNNAFSILWAAAWSEHNIIHCKLNFALDVAVRSCSLASHGTEKRCTVFIATVSVAIVPTQCVITDRTLLIPRGRMRAMRGSSQTEVLWHFRGSRLWQHAHITRMLLSNRLARMLYRRTRMALTIAKRRCQQR
jgi:hypothetical protein